MRGVRFLGAVCLLTFSACSSEEVKPPAATPSAQAPPPVPAPTPTPQAPPPEPATATAIAPPPGMATGQNAGTPAGAKKDSAVEPDSKIALPGQVDDVTVGGGGRYLLFSLRELKQVGVFDMREAKFLKFVDVGDAAFFVAGGATQFVTVDTVNNKLVAWRYDALDEPRLQADFSMADRKLVYGAVMGMSSEGPLALSFHYKNEAPQPFVELFDLSTLTPLEYTVDWIGQNTFPPREPGESRLRATSDGQNFIMVSRDMVDEVSFSESTLTVRPRRYVADEAIQLDVPNGDRFAAAYDGRAIYSNFAIQLPDGRVVKPEPSVARILNGVISQAIPPHYWINAGTVIPLGETNLDPRLRNVSTFVTAFHVAGEKEPIATLRLAITGASEIGSDFDTTPADRRANYNAAEKLLVVVAHDPPQLFLKRFDLDAAVAETERSILDVVSIPPTEFAPGRKVEYAVQAVSNHGDVTYRLESGPAGMTVSSDGQLEWMPQEGADPQEATVAVLDKSDKKFLHRFKLSRALPPLALTGPDESSPGDAGAARVGIRLPGALNELAVGAGGRYLLAVIPKARKIVVIDVTQRKIVKTIPSGYGRVKVAAGNTRFVVYSDSDRGTLARWSFATFEPEATATFSGNVASIAMGSSSEGPLILSVDDKAHLIDLNTLKPTNTIFYSDLAGSGYSVIEEHVAASADGRTFASWRHNSIPLGVLSYVLRGDTLFAYNRHDSSGPIAPSPDGAFLHTLRKIYPSRQLSLEPATRQDFDDVAERISLPAATGNYYLAWPSAEKAKDRKVAVHVQGDDTPIVTIPDLLPPARIRVFNEDPLYSRRLLYVPLADAIVSLAPSLDMLVVRPFVFDEALARTTNDYLFITSIPPVEVRPGTGLAYRIDVLSRKGGVKFAIEKAPQGATVSPVGMVNWKIPPSLIEGWGRFAIRITDDSGAVKLHAFDIRVDKNAPLPRPASLPPTPTKTTTAPSAGSATAGRLRTWKSIDGKFSIEARLGKLVGNTATLVRADGTSIEVPLDKLSKEDRDYAGQQSPKP